MAATEKPHLGVVRRIAGPAEFAAEFGVSRETLARLDAYAAELERWQKTINLVAPGTLADLWHRHFADSAQLVRLASPPGAIRPSAAAAPGPTHQSGAIRPSAAAAPGKLTWVDLGSGGGFPGLVVAILLAPDDRIRVTLVESDSRKAAFLRTAARTAGVSVDIFAERAEVAATRANLQNADVVSARALAPLSRLLEWANPFSGPGSVLLLPKGRDVGAEIQDAEKKWKFDADLLPSLTDPDARVVRLTNLAPRS